MKRFWKFLKGLFGRSKEKKFRAGEIPAAKRFSLVIGVENSARFGSCPGARHDSAYMNRLLKGVSSKIVLLQDRNATRSAVISAMDELIAKVPEDGIFVMTYSGHGGSQAFSTTDKSIEKDGKDEYLCLYDGYLIDDSIWDAVTRCKGKVFLFFDCCHSETMFRAAPLIPPAELMRVPDVCGVSKRDAVIPDSPVDMLVWSGCPDNTYSYGDNAGGLFTNALNDALNAGKKSYRDIWASIKRDKSLSQYAQKPQQTILGTFSIDSVFWS